MATSKQTIFHNILYAGLTKGTILVCITVTSSIVARNLTPWDYGVVGFASIIIGFLNHFSDVGVGSAASRRPSLSGPSLRDGVHSKDHPWMRGISCGLSHCPVRTQVLPASRNGRRGSRSGSGFPDQHDRIHAHGDLSAGTGLPGPDDPRDLERDRPVYSRRRADPIRMEVLGCCVCGCGRNAGQRPSSSVCEKNSLPAWISTGPMLAEYLRFGAPLLGSGVLVFAIFNLDNLLIGSAMGSAQLGYYALAFTWGSFVCGVLYDSLNNVLLPAFAEIQLDLAAMKRGYLKTLGLAGLVSVVVNTALLANAHFFLVTFLGKGSNKWVPATLSFEILCFYGILRSITEPIASCILALGQTKTLLRATILAGSVEVLLLVLALRTRRIESIALVVLLAYAIQAVVYLPFLRRELGVSVGDIGAQLWPLIPTLAGAYLITTFLPHSLGSTLLTLALRASFTALVAAFIHGLLTRFRLLQEATGMIIQSVVRVRG